MESTVDEEKTDSKKNDSVLVNVISGAIKIPGVKVDRESFLREQFKNVSPELLESILKNGPVKAKVSRNELQKKSTKLVTERTLVSTAASFAAGIPGGFAMAATIPADMLQFYGVALRLAQEIAYLYGEADLWTGDVLDSDKVTNQLILYCGVMLGSTGAAQTIRVISSALAKQALKKLPQKALTKTFYYPIIKSIAKALGAKMTKSVFAKGVSKVVPVVGGVVSGGITFATLRPMGKRLANAFDDAHFAYSEEYFKNDWDDIVKVTEVEENQEDDDSSDAETDTEDKDTQSGSLMQKIQEAKQLLDEGIIDENEFKEIKEKIIAKM